MRDMFDYPHLNPLLEYEVMMENIEGNATCLIEGEEIRDAYL